MDRAFVYGMSVEGDNFTDRVKETKRLKLDFENGINVILVSPRRMGKSSIVKKVKSEMTNPGIKVVFMDIYDVVVSMTSTIALRPPSSRPLPPRRNRFWTLSSAFWSG